MTLTSGIQVKISYVFLRALLIRRTVVFFAKRSSNSETEILAYLEKKKKRTFKLKFVSYV